MSRSDEIEATIYFSKGSNWELGERLGLEGDARFMFAHTLPELECQVAVNKKTGIVRLIGVKYDDQFLSPVQA